MRRRRRHQDHENVDRWMVSYADFVTLLFAFFTTMYALSHLDLGKVEMFAGSVRSAFSVNKVDRSNTKLIEGIAPVSPDVVGIESELQEVLDPLAEKKDITLRRDPRGLIVSMDSAMLFDTGSAELKPQAKKALDAVASVLQGHSQPVTVEGHTDDVPIHSERYPSNWELSTMRATNVLRYLTDFYGLPPGRFSAAGYGEQRPVAPNITLEGRGKNRRVDIVIHING